MKFVEVYTWLEGVPEGTIISLTFKKKDIKKILYLATMIGKKIPIFTVEKGTKKKIKRLSRKQVWYNRRDRTISVRTTSTFGEALNMDWFVTVMCYSLEHVEVLFHQEHR